MIIFFMIVLFSFNSWSYDEDAAFVSLDRSKYLQIKRENIIDVGAYKDQDGIGICYSFTFAKMVEHICNSSKTCANTGVDLSTLAISKINEDSLMKFDGGYSGAIMDVLRLKPVEDRFRFVTEECLPFSKLLYSFEESYSPSQHQGFKLMREVFDNVLSKDCVDCTLESSQMLKTSLPEISIEESQLNSILMKLKQKQITSYDQELRLFRSFVDEVLTNNKCFAKERTVKVPNFKHNPYSRRTINSLNTFNNKIVSLVDQNQIVELAVCLDRKFDQGQLKCAAGHGIIVNGYRNRCDFSGNCRYELKITNSWGVSWQKKNNDGWVDSKTLYRYASGIPGIDKDTGEVFFTSKPLNQKFMSTLFNSSSKDVQAIVPNINQVIKIDSKSEQVIIKPQDIEPESYKESSNEDNSNNIYVCLDDNGNTAIVDFAASSKFKSCKEMK